MFNFILSDRTSGNQDYTNGGIVSIDLNVSLDISKWIISESVTSQPVSTNILFTSTVPETFTTSLGEGLKIIYLWALQTSGSVSTNPYTNQITLKTSKPDAPVFILRDTTSGNTLYTRSAIISLDVCSLSIIDADKFLIKIDDYRTPEEFEVNNSISSLPETIFLHNYHKAENYITLELEDPITRNNRFLDSNITSVSIIDDFSYTQYGIFLWVKDVAGNLNKSALPINNPIVTGYLLSETQTLQPNVLDCNFVSSLPNSYIFSDPNEGIKQLHLWLKGTASPEFVINEEAISNTITYAEKPEIISISYSPGQKRLVVKFNKIITEVDKSKFFIKKDPRFKS